jgi:hypothetical protein
LSALTTGIDHPCLAQGRQQLRRSCHRCTRFTHRRIEYSAKRRLASRNCTLCRFTGAANDGQHRAFHRAQHRFIGARASVRQRCCHFAPAHQVMPGESSGDTAQHLRQNDARITAPAQCCPVPDPFRHHTA